MQVFWEGVDLRHPQEKEQGFTWAHRSPPASLDGASTRTQPGLAPDGGRPAPGVGGTSVCGCPSLRGLLLVPRPRRGLPCCELLSELPRGVLFAALLPPGKGTHPEISWGGGRGQGQEISPDPQVPPPSEASAVGQLTPARKPGQMTNFTVSQPWARDHSLGPAQLPAPHPQPPPSGGLWGRP